MASNSKRAGSPLRIVPEKAIRVSTDWRKCLLCQATRVDDELKPLMEEECSSFIEMAKIKQGLTYLRLKPYMSNISTMNAVRHYKCYASYVSEAPSTSTSLLRRSPDSPGTSVSTQTINRPFLRSSSSLADLNLCIFCQKVKRIKDNKTKVIQSEDKLEYIKSAVEELDDDTMRVRMVGLKLTSDIKYHQKCYLDYGYRHKKLIRESKVTEPEDKYTNTFKRLLSEIDEEIFCHGKILKLNDLFVRYISLLDDADAASRYRSEKLQSRLECHYGSKIRIISQRGQGKSNLIFNSSIEVGDAIKAAVSLKESFCDQEEMQLGVGSTVGSYSEESSVLLRSAQILRTAISNIAKEMDNERTISQQQAEAMIPNQVYMFLHCLLGTDIVPDSDSISNVKSEKAKVHKLILSFAQDLIYAFHKNIFTPKHYGLAVTIKHKTRSKELATMLNKFGHCVSYSELLTFEKQQEDILRKNSENRGVVIPSNIIPGKFIQAAADNLDFTEETLDGKQTTHGTTIVLYQRNGLHGKFSTSFSKEKASIKHRSVTDSAVSPSLLSFSRQCRKINFQSFPLRAKDILQPEESDVTSSAKALDTAWVFCRICPSKQFSVSLQKNQQTTVPGWSAFNAIVSTNNADVTSVGYCPMLPFPPTQYDTVYTLMKTVQNMMAAMNQKHTVLTLDEAIYCKAKEIQWRSKDEFVNTILRLGGFHTALAFISVIGKRYENSGLEDWLIESGLYGSNTVSRIMSGKTYNKGVRACKLVMEALCRLQISLLFSKLSNKASSRPYIDKVNSLIKALSDKDVETCGCILQDINQAYQPLADQLTVFINESVVVSDTFKFWNDFIEMVCILLRFIRAERDGLWELHLDTLSEMLPYFFAYDRVNYARWGTIYMMDMRTLESTAKEVYNEFKDGNHPVKRSIGNFNQVWTDLALEQSVNKDCKTKGGVVGTTTSSSTLGRWFLTAHIRADIVSALRSMCGMEGSLDDDIPQSSHKESTRPRMKRDEADVQALIDISLDQMLNPFKLDSQKTKLVMNIASGTTASEQVSADLVKAQQTGKKCLEDFITSRLSEGHTRTPADPITKNKLNTLRHQRTLIKVNSGTQERKPINANPIDFFGRLLLMSKKRPVDLKSLFCHELTPVPFSLAYSDGSLKKTAKSKLMTLLEQHMTVSDTLPRVAQGISVAWIFDGMAIVQATRPTTQATFGEYAELLLQRILRPFSMAEVERVDVVFDRYDNQFSIKGSERQRRKQSSGIHLHIHGSQTKLPKQWSKFLDDPRSKSNLTSFLSNHWAESAKVHLEQRKCLFIAGGFENAIDVKCITVNGSESCDQLQCSQEEADTRMMLHISHASSVSQHIVVESSDTDVAVLLAHFSSKFDRNLTHLFMLAGVGEKKRVLHIHDLSLKLGPSLIQLLMPFHGLTGCDSTSSITRLAKKRPWDMLVKEYAKYMRMADIGSTTAELSEDVITNVEEFVCHVYNGGPWDRGVNDLRYTMYCKSGAKVENLPPTRDSLVQHLKRVNYQCFVWKNALVGTFDIPQPVGHGWENDGGMLKPTLMTIACAPENILSFITCSCKKSACRGRCSCSKEGIPCIEACGCGGEDICQNPNKHGTSSDNDESSESEEELSSDEDYTD